MLRKNPGNLLRNFLRHVLEIKSGEESQQRVYNAVLGRPTLDDMKVTVERIRPTDKMVRGKMKCSSLRGSSGSSSSSSSLNRNSFISKPAWNEVCQVVRLLDIFYLLEPHHMNIELLFKPPLLIDHIGGKVSVRCWFLIFAAVPPSQC